MKPPGTDFPRYSRLTQKKDFDHVLHKRTQIVRLGSIRAYILDNDLPFARLGIIVAKKQFPTSVARNRIKRLIRNSFRLSRVKLMNVDVVVQVFSGENEEQLKINLEKLWLTLERDTTARS